MNDYLSYSLDGGIATVAMDDGKVNAMSIPMLESLHAAFERAEKDGAVVVLQGREGALKLVREEIDRVRHHFEPAKYRDLPEQELSVLALQDRFAMV